MVIWTYGIGGCFGSVIVAISRLTVVWHMRISIIQSALAHIYPGLFAAVKELMLFAPSRKG